MRQQKILLVEDEEVIRRLCGRILAKTGHALFFAGTVQEGIKIIEENDLDLLLTDLRLPDGHGSSVISRFKKKFPQKNAVVITGSLTPDESLADVKLMGAIHCLSKPFEPSDLEDTVRRELDQEAA